MSSAVVRAEEYSPGRGFFTRLFMGQQVQAGTQAEMQFTILQTQPKYFILCEEMVGNNLEPVISKSGISPLPKIHFTQQRRSN